MRSNGLFRRIEVGTRPRAVAELTPRLWQQHFADNPLRSDLHKAAK